MAPFDSEALVHYRRLAARMAAGEGEALLLLFLEFGAGVHGLIRRVLDDPDESREAVQETFLRAWRRAGARAERSETVDAWLMLLAREVAIERLRRGARPAVVRAGRHRENWNAGAGEAPTLQQWQALELAFFGGRSVAEIAAGLQTTAVAAMTHLREALRKIRASSGRPVDEPLAVELGRWWLGEIDTQRSAALAARIEAEPPVAAEAARMAEVLVRFAIEVAPAEPLAPAAQRVILTALTAAAGGRERSGEPGPAAGGWRRWAAPIVLVVTAVIAGYFVGRGTGARSDEKQADDASRRFAAGELDRAEKSRGDYERLRRAHASLQAEYDGLVRAVGARVAVPGGADRLLVMELVDAGSYARGERHGLAALARGLLATPGLVAMAPASLPVGRMEDGRKEPDALAAVEPTGAVSGAAAPSSAGPAPAAAVAGYGWLVFDEADNQGYLNLYGVPAAAGGDVFMLWVRGPDGAEFRAVGEVPSPRQGAAGSFQFKLAADQPPPVEIMITRETKGAVTTKPAAAVVLHGP